MSDRKRYSDEMKAGAMAALLAGQSVSKVAKEYRIPRGTVGRWSSELRRSTKHFEEEKKEEIGDLLMGYLEENLRTLVVQSQVFGDPDWVREQDAQELAVLHGVLADKTIRILEAISLDPAHEQ